MKIPLTMREQYQGQLSATMLCCCFGENRLYDWFFFLYTKDYFLSEKQKNTAIPCDVDLKMVTSAGLEPATF